MAAGVQQARVGRVQVPGFLGAYKPSFYHYRKWKALLSVTGVGAATWLSSSPEVALARKIAEYNRNLEQETFFSQRKQVIDQSVVTLKSLARDTAPDSADRRTIEAILANLCGRKMRDFYNRMDSFMAGNGSKGAHGEWIINYQKLMGHSYQAINDELRKVKDLIQETEDLDNDDMTFAKENYTQDKTQRIAVGNNNLLIVNSCGLKSFEQALERRKTQLNGTILAQKARLRAIILKAKSMCPPKTALKQELQQVRQTILAQNLMGPEAVQMLGMNSNGSVPDFLDAVEKFIDTGFASNDIKGFDLAPLRRPRISLLSDGFGAAILGAAVYGGGILASSVMPTVTKSLSLSTPGLAIAAGIGIVLMNYLRGGLLYQVLQD